MQIDFIDVEGWHWAFKAALTTVHKSPKDKEPSPSWKRKMLISEHSPIREIKVRFILKDLKRWIADQLVRHNVGVNNYMGTGRPDRGNVPRSEQTMEMETELMQSHNAQSFITEARARLCVGCASSETRHLMENLVDEVGKVDPEIAYVCVPPCVYMHGCKEAFGKCNYYKQFVEWCDKHGATIYDMSDIDTRYKKYHEWKAYISELSHLGLDAVKDLKYDSNTTIYGENGVALGGIVKHDDINLKGNTAKMVAGLTVGDLDKYAIIGREKNNEKLNASSEEMPSTDSINIPYINEKLNASSVEGLSELKKACDNDKIIHALKEWCDLNLENDNNNDKQ